VGKFRAHAGRKRQPAMPAVAAAGCTGRTATLQKVLEALHRGAAMCRTRIPIATAEVATLARSFGMLPDLERDPEVGSARYAD
jgi:hypothetical protein